MGIANADIMGIILSFQNKNLVTTHNMNVNLKINIWSVLGYTRHELFRSNLVKVTGSLCRQGIIVLEFSQF